MRSQPLPADDDVPGRSPLFCLDPGEIDPGRQAASIQADRVLAGLAIPARDRDGFAPQRVEQGDRDRSLLGEGVFIASAK
jgi:hypothetical protein